MNLFDRIADLNSLLNARRRNAQKRQLPARPAQVYAQGGVYEVRDLETGRVIDTFNTYSEARTLADQTERGELCA